MDSDHDKNRDDGVNPGDKHFNSDYFSNKGNSPAGGLATLEKDSTQSSRSGDESSTSASGARSQEQGGQWENNVNKVADKLEKHGGAKGKAASKAIKATNGAVGPTIALIMLGGLLIIGALTSGMVMPLQLTELFTAELSDSSAATQVRSERLLASKVNRNMDVSSSCRVAGIKCKFKTLSNRQVAKYRSAGFEVETRGTSVTGRNKIDSISLTVSDGLNPDGTSRTRTLTADNPRQFNELRRTSADFRKSTTGVYNSRTHIFFSKSLGKVLTRFNLNKNAKLRVSDSKEVKQRTINRQVGAAEDAGIRNQRGQLVNTESTNRPHGDIETEIRSSERNLETSGNRGQSEQVDTNRLTNVTDPSSDVTVNNDGGTRRAVDIGGGGIDAACGIYDATRAISAGVKTAKIIRLMGYAMVILPEIHKIKSGEDTNGESLRFVGEILSSGLLESNGDSRESVSESTGMQLALTGNAPGLNEGSKSFSLSDGDLMQFNDSVNSITNSIAGTIGGVIGFIADRFGANMEDTGNERTNGMITLRGLCLALSSTEGLGNILLRFTGVGFVAILINMAIEQVFKVIMSQLLPKIIESAATMDLSANTTDASAANAIFAGAGHLMGRQAASYGMKPADTSDIEEYTAFRNQVSTHNIAVGIEDAKATPFDINNQYSFVGMVARSANIHLGIDSSIPNRVAGALSLIPSALSTAIMPSAGAAYTQPQAKFNQNRYKDENEPSVAQIGANADMFGNVRYSLSPLARNLDSESIVDHMIDYEYVNDITGEPREDTDEGRRYQNFLTYCVDRDDPLGESSTGFGGVWDRNGGTMPMGAEFLLRPLEMLNKMFWETGEACVKGQTNGAGDRSHIAKIDESYLVAKEFRDSAVLTGRTGAKTASTEAILASSSSVAETEVEMFRVFTMDMALNDDIDGEVMEGGSEADSSGSGGVTTGELGWPMQEGATGLISSCYGFRASMGDMHYAIDIATGSTSTDIVAADGGTVHAVEHGDAPPFTGYGKTVVIEHDNGMYTRYSHMSDISVNVGDAVDKGDPVGKEGGTGGAGYPVHLDFGVSRDPNTFVNNNTETMNPLRFMDIPSGYNNPHECTGDANGEVATRNHASNNFQEQE